MFLHDRDGQRRYVHIGMRLRAISKVIERISGASLLALGTLLVTGQYVHVISIAAAWRS